MMDDIHPILVFILVATLTAVIGFVTGALLRKNATSTDSDLLDFIEQTGYSVQCVGGMWAVTDTGCRTVGPVSNTLRGAIEAAAGHVATEVSP